MSIFSKLITLFRVEPINSFGDVKGILKGTVPVPSGSELRIVYLDVKDEKTGKLVEWEVEMMSLNHLRAYGWTSKTVKAGETLSATGAPARSGAPSMIANRMKLPDGREIRS